MKLMWMLAHPDVISTAVVALNLAVIEIEVATTDASFLKE
jgi:hypothetical protein